MYQDYHLSPKHYAAKWSTENFYSIEEVNQIALDFSVEQDPQLRQQLQMKLLECFHAFIFKYFNMIVFGIMPSLNSKQGRDALIFLKLLSPVGASEDYASMRDRCRNLHLAFYECQESDDVYDTLALLFLDVCDKYDPSYTIKIQEVCKYIEQLPPEQVFSVDSASDALGSPSNRVLRLLVKKQYLRSIRGAKKKICGYVRGEKWPPPQRFFQSGPIGFTYMAQQHFRFALKGYIIEKMKEVEAKQYVMHPDAYRHDTINRWSDVIACPIHENWKDSHGTPYHIDRSMLDKVEQLDLSTMTDAWVKGSKDPLFRDLTIRERYLLQLVYVKEFTWIEIGAVLSCNKETAKIHFEKLIHQLQTKAQKS